jgi:hypothetical protein
MTIPTEYGWFLAVIWPDEHGVATARLYEWDRTGAKSGALVDSFTFGQDPDFYAVLEAKYYEAVEGQVARSVHHHGFRIAVRRARVPVMVPAYA